MNDYHVTLSLTVSIDDDVSEDDLEEEIAYQVDRYRDQAIMVDYRFEAHR